MGSPLDGLDGERSPKRRRVSGAKGLRGGDASYVYDQEELPFANLRPQANDARNTPQISITRGSDSDASTPRPPLPSPLDGASDTSDNNHNRYTLLPSADTPRSQRSSQMDSEDEYPPSRSSPIPPETPRDMATPQVHYRPKLILRGHKRGVSCVKFSPDGKWIASCCRSSQRLFLLCLQRPLFSTTRLTSTNHSRRRHTQNLARPHRRPRPHFPRPPRRHLNPSLVPRLQPPSHRLRRQDHPSLGRLHRCPPSDLQTPRPLQPPRSLRLQDPQTPITRPP